MVIMISGIQVWQQQYGYECAEDFYKKSKS